MVDPFISEGETEDSRWRIAVLRDFTGYSDIRGTKLLRGNPALPPEKSEDLKSQKKRLHIFPVTDYHLRALGFPEPG